MPTKNATTSTATAWLPIPHPRVAGLCALALACYFLTTMARDLSYFDSPELAMVAIEGGRSHPPGQVLHALVGGLAVRYLPVSPLVALNSVSAVFAALCFFPAVALADLTTRRLSAISLSTAWYPILALVLCHGALWEQATRVEVYSMATLLSLWTLVRGISTKVDDTTDALSLGFGAGLTASANPVFAVLAVLALVPSLVLQGARVRFFLFAAFGSALGLLPYAYLLTAQNRSDAFVWGDTSSIGGLVHYLTAADFQQNLRVSLSTWWHQGIDLLMRASSRSLWPILLFGMTATMTGRAAYIRGLPVLLSTVLSIAYVSRNAVWIPDIPDYTSYLAPSLHAVAATAVAMAAVLWQRRMRIASFALAGVLGGTSLLSPPTVLMRNRSDDRTVRAVATATLTAMPRNALALLSSDHLTWPVLYLQQVEGLRKDVVILPTGLASSSWFWRSLYRKHPTLHPFAPMGPGGPTGRIKRFVEAQPARPIVAEEWLTYADLGRPGCLGPWFIAASHCPIDDIHLAEAATTLGRLAERATGHDPFALATIAAVSFNLGESALRMGQTRAALRYLLSPFPAGERSAMGRFSAGQLDRVPRLRRPWTAWERPAPLGDLARNAWLVSQVAHAAGNRELAEHWRSLAAAMGLPEAGPIGTHLPTPWP